MLQEPDPPSILRETLEFLSRHWEARELDEQFAQLLVTHLADTVDVLQSGRLTLSIEVIDAEAGTWRIAASTDARARHDSRTYSIDDGITGWALRTNRKPTLAINRTSLLSSMTRLLPDYRDTKSAFIYLMRDQKEPRAALCVVSNHEGAIPEQLEHQLQRTCAVLESLFYAGRFVHRSKQSNIRPAVRTRDEAVHVLAERLAEMRYMWVNFWTWEPAQRKLFPQVVCGVDPDRRVDFLHALALGEGFVGHCARTLAPLLEASIEDGVGGTHGIRTPLPWISVSPPIPLRSIMVVPVTSDHRFFGVLDFLGDTREQFHAGDDLQQALQVATVFGSMLNELEESRLTNLQRRLLAKLYESLRGPDTPSEYWNRVSEILETLETEQLIVLGYLFVTKRNRRSVFSRKAGSRTARPDSEIVNIQRNDHPAFRSFDSMDAGSLYPLKTFRSAPEYERLRGLGARRIWFDKFRFREKEDEPGEMLGIVALRDKGLRDSRWGEVDPADYLSVLFGTVFVLGRAVLNAADAAELARQRDWMLAMQNHDLRQPLTSLRHEAELLLGGSSVRAQPFSDAKEIEIAGVIIARADELLARLNNMYAIATSILSTTEVEDAKREIDVFDCLREAIASVRSRGNSSRIEAPDLFNKDRPPVGFVRGARGWLVVAFDNILANAVKFGKNSVVLVTAGHRAAPDTQAREVWKIEVKDFGIGIPETELEKIFIVGHANRYSLKKVAYGSRMSLAISREIIQNHGGRVWATSEVGRWTQFHIEIPDARSRAGARAVDSKSKTGSRGRKVGRN